MPIERAARALCKLERQPEKVGRKPTWPNYVPQVRAVLEAVTEPDTVMAKAGGKILDYPMGSRAASAMASQVWEAMANAALKESVGGVS